MASDAIFDTPLSVMCLKNKFKGIKNKILRFKRIFTGHWLAFAANNPRYDTDYYQTEINKMLLCGGELR
jgi:hypothetical protein